MFLFNEQHQPMSAKDTIAQLKGAESVATPTLEDVKAALGNYYQQALQPQGYRLGASLSVAPAAPELPMKVFYLQ